MEHSSHGLCLFERCKWNEMRLESILRRNGSSFEWNLNRTFHCFETIPKWNWKCCDQWSQGQIDAKIFCCFSLSLPHILYRSVKHHLHCTIRWPRCCAILFISGTKLYAWKKRNWFDTWLAQNHKLNTQSDNRQTDRLGCLPGLFARSSVKQRMKMCILIGECIYIMCPCTLCKYSIELFMFVCVYRTVHHSLDVLRLALESLWCCRPYTTCVHATMVFFSCTSTKSMSSSSAFNEMMMMNVSVCTYARTHARTHLCTNIPDICATVQLSHAKWNSYEVDGVDCLFEHLMVCIYYLTKYMSSSFGGMYSAFSGS